MCGAAIEFIVGAPKNMYVVPMSKKPNPPRKHHYVPEFYLKRWANSSGKVERYVEIPSGKIHRKAVSYQAIGFEENLYSLPNADPLESRTQIIETKFFGPVDNNAADCLNILETTEEVPFDPEFRTNWALFIKSMMFRSPKGIDRLFRTLTDIYEDKETEYQSEYEKFKKPNDPATLYQWIRQRDQNIEAQHLMSMIPRILTSPRIIHLIVNLNWFVEDITDSRFKMLLSDQPIIFSPLEKENGHIALPLSPKRMFVATDSNSLTNLLKGWDATSLAKASNLQIVRNAQKFVVSTDDRQRRFIENNFGKSDSGRITDMIGTAAYQSYAENL